MHDFLTYVKYIKISKDSWAKYYQNIKEGLPKACKRYQSLPEEEKEKKWHCGHEWYKSLPEDEKQKLVEHRKKYYKMSKKLAYYNHKKLLFQKIMT